MLTGNVVKTDHHSDTHHARFPVAVFRAVQCMCETVNV